MFSVKKTTGATTTKVAVAMPVKFCMLASMRYVPVARGAKAICCAKGVAENSRTLERALVIMRLVIMLVAEMSTGSERLKFALSVLITGRDCLSSDMV